MGWGGVGWGGVGWGGVGWGWGRIEWMHRAAQVMSINRAHPTAEIQTMPACSDGFILSSNYNQQPLLLHLPPDLDTRHLYAHKCMRLIIIILHFIYFC